MTREELVAHVLRDEGLGDAAVPNVEAALERFIADGTLIVTEDGSHIRTSNADPGPGDPRSAR